jgi:hypothetical protein
MPETVFVRGPMLFHARGRAASTVSMARQSARSRRMRSQPACADGAGRRDGHADRVLLAVHHRESADLADAGQHRPDRKGWHRDRLAEKRTEAMASGCMPEPSFQAQ